MIQIWAVYLRSMLIYKKRFIPTLMAIILSPLLYTIAFGWGLGENLKVEGISYLQFMLPGLIALSGMTQSFSIAVELNLSRFLSKIFEEYLISPATSLQIVTGYVLTGMTKGLISFLFILGAAYICGFPPSGVFIVIPVVLNIFLFSSLGVFIALIITNHRDMSHFNTFIIIPMSFLAGTFFSLKKLPLLLQYITKVIPLTHSSLTIRASFLGEGISYLSLAVLALYGCLFFGLAVYMVNRSID